MAQHILKTWPEYFKAVKEGYKPWELRKNDRDFQIGDYLFLNEYDPKNECFTGQQVIKEVTYVLNGPVFGLEEGYCIMGLR